MAKVEYNNIEFDSEEEVYFYSWCQELMSVGLIKEFSYQPTPFQLSDPIKGVWTEQMKTRVKQHEFTLLRESSCGADFSIQFEPQAEGHLYYNAATLLTKRERTNLLYLTDDGLCYVDIKPMFEKQNSSVSFPYKQKWVWDKHKVYIQKVKPLGSKNLFESTFCPQYYIDKAVYQKPNIKKGIRKGDSKIKFNYITIDQWLHRTVEKVK